MTRSPRQPSLPLGSVAPNPLDEMVLCVEAGRFEDAECLRRSLLATTPADAIARYSFLARLGDPAVWSLPLSELLKVWRGTDATLQAGRYLRRKVGDAFLTRLLRDHDPSDVSDADPTVLPDLCRLFQQRGMSVEDAQTVCRSLLRDALLRGRTVRSHDFPGDAAARDLLSENLIPEWQACLGAIRGLWRLPLLDDVDVALSVSPEQPLPTTAEQKALDFWHCLRIVASANHRPWRLDARRRMRRLNPDLHALLLGPPSLKR